LVIRAEAWPRKSATVIGIVDVLGRGFASRIVKNDVSHLVEQD